MDKMIRVSQQGFITSYIDERFGEKPIVSIFMDSNLQFQSNTK
jgi:nitrogen fixation protein